MPDRPAFAEQSKHELLQALEEMGRKHLALEQSELRKNEFLAILAHELRNPLATLNMTLSILRRKSGITPEELVQRSDVMTRQIAHLVRLVDDLTSVTRSDRDKQRNEAPVDLGTLLDDALRMRAAAIEAKHQTLVVDRGVDALRVLGDRPQLLQAMLEVIDNAVRYTPERGRIEVRLRGSDGQAIVEVQDNGAGIAAELLPQVFGMFVKARSRAGEEQSGLGVGLTLADRLVRAHGGSMTAASDGPGQGATFTITLPLLADA